MSEFFDVELWLEWISQLDRTFVFLLLLPFVVAVVGLWAAYRERDIGPERNTSRLTERRQYDRRRPRVGDHRYNA